MKKFDNLKEDIEYIVEVQKKPIDEIWVLDYYKFDIYKKLDKRIPYILGVDCSTGTVGDNNAITVINPYTFEPDAEFECCYIGETKYEQLIIEFVSKYVPRACVAIERNSVGDGIIDHLLHSKIRDRIYFDKAKDLMEDNMQQYETVESMLKKQAKQKTFYGVYTSGASREAMFAILATHVFEKKDNFVAHNVIRDLSRLVKKSNGKIEAGAGSIYALIYKVRSGLHFPNCWKVHTNQQRSILNIKDMGSTTMESIILY